MPKKQTRRIAITDDGETEGLHPWIDEMVKLFAGGPAIVSIERPKRSLKQNNFYWGIVLPTVRDGFHEAGMTEIRMTGPGGETVRRPVSVDFLHSWYKNKYLDPPGPGEEPTTTRLDSTEMFYYIEKIRHDPEVKELGIHVPQPNEPPIEAYE